MTHEALLLLFRNRPSLAAELLRDPLHFPLPDYTDARIESAELTQVVPTEYRADLVVLLLDGRPVLSIVVEVQLRHDPDKRWSWPVYLAVQCARLRCPAVLLVVTADEATARWAAEPIDLGHPGFALAPLVLGPSAIPIVTDREIASRDPELAVLSAMAHGGGTAEVAAKVAAAAIGATLGLDAERGRLYLDLVLSRLGDAARVALEAIMQSGKYEYQSDFAKKYYGQGKAEGKAEGEARGKGEAILSILAARELPVPEALPSRVLGCHDLATLDRWLILAVTAPSASAIFDDDGA